MQAVTLARPCQSHACGSHVTARFSTGLTIALSVPVLGILLCQALSKSRLWFTRHGPALYRPCQSHACGSHVTARLATGLTIALSVPVLGILLCQALSKSRLWFTRHGPARYRSNYSS
ncbi:hypothetical protein J6590_006640 [Homalodisca vitripennis]|nr:hypothetical protein J6590_006640 [Homalodisca vitripennis]